MSQDKSNGRVEESTGRIGRPKKKAVAAKKRGGRELRGRPKGDAAIINEYKARMLASPKSRKVLDAIFDAALDPEHKNQASAWKLVMDRILPVAAFEKDVIKDAGRNSISINITGVGDVAVSGKSSSSSSSDGDDIIDGEVVDD